MASRLAISAVAILGTFLASGCAESNRAEATASGNGNGDAPKVKVTVIEPGPSAQKLAQEALIKAEPGEIIEFAEGKFDFNTTLSLEDVERVTLRGKGINKTILNFKSQQQGTGGEGIKVGGSDDFTLEDMTIQDTRSDGFKPEGITGVTMRRVKVEWTRGPHPENGAYGFYPVLSKDVLIEDCEVYSCSDAGIYVGQSENVIVRRCRAERNVAGIEIENTVGADVYDNVATNNAGGILVFSLPELPKKNGRSCRVYNNRVYENNHENFAKPGNIVASVPPGSGIIIMANDEVEVFNNEIKNNQSANVTVISYLATDRKYNDPEYDPYPETIYIHDNKFEGGGDKPAGEIATLLAPLLGKEFPDILYDGMVDPKKLVDGQLPANLKLYIRNNGDADFANVNLAAIRAAGLPVVTRELGPHDGEHPSPPAIVIEGVE